MARDGLLPPDEERAVLQGRQIGRPSFLTAAVSGTPGRIEDVRVGGSVQLVLRGEPFLADQCTEELVSGRRPEGPRGAWTDTIGDL